MANSVVIRVLAAALCTLAALPVADNAAFAGQDVDFARSIRPILSNHCFACHGPDAGVREADLRLDVLNERLTGKSDDAVVVPGRAGDSELIRRVTSEDPDERMPPPGTAIPPLTDEQIDALKAWVDQGAGWARHWAFEAPADVIPPRVESAWTRNEIDHFILARLQQVGLTPSAPASRETLIRRVTLDLTGLPPTPEEVAAFVADTKPGAWERVIDRLLESPHYGEMMALQWLEAARYADTDGYQNDGPRTMWPWRDWVINAYNENLPFDQFTVEQLAGDLLPAATRAQIIATGFNRNHRYNSESGLVLEEFLLENAVDRVDTTATVWMGLTMGCARCHDHKYDPFSQREYYQLISYFDKVTESGRAVKFGNSEPWILAPTEPQTDRLQELESKTEAAEAALAAAEDRIQQALGEWNPEPQDVAAGIVSRGLTHRFTFDGEDDRVSVQQGAPVLRDGAVGPAAATVGGRGIFSLGPVGDVRCQSRSSITFWLRPEELKRGVILSRQRGGTTRPGFQVTLQDGRLRFFIITRWVAGVGAVETTESLPQGDWVHVALTNDGSQSARGMRILLNGKPVPTRILYNTNSNTGGTDGKSPLRLGGGVHGPLFTGQVDELRFYNRTLADDEIALLAVPTQAADLVQRPRETLTAEERHWLRAWFLEHAAPKPLRELADRYATARLAEIRYLDTIPTTMVMEDGDPSRPTHVRVRGVYDALGAVVAPGVPAALSAVNEQASRLDFARWLVNGSHPLTARVAVNRYWQLYFGRGLVDTPEDFGAQGSPPTHPALLDWLARRFVTSGWNIKQMQKLIVMSATYRQSSRQTPQGLARDPRNIWVSRAPRLRLSAQVIRDQALAVSGLLVPQIGGPSVSPYQPRNLWAEVSNMKYKQSKGKDLYRRSLYTVWKRTVAPPTMQVLDSGDRESCKVRRTRTNTPLQALTLMNETTFVEAARHLGHRMLSTSEDRDERIRLGFRAVLAREPSAAEARVLAASWADYLQAFQDDPQAAKELVSVGESPAHKNASVPELAASTAIASVILNLDEAITRE